MESQETLGKPLSAEKKKKQTLREFMAEEKPINRWMVLRVALGGAFLGAVLAVLSAFIGGVVI